MSQNLKRLDDLSNTCSRIGDFELPHVIDKSIEVIDYFGCEFDARQ